MFRTLRPREGTLSLAGLSTGAAYSVCRAGGGHQESNLDLRVKTITLSSPARLVAGVFASKGPSRRSP